MSRGDRGLGGEFILGIKFVSAGWSTLPERCGERWERFLFYNELAIVGDY